MADKHYYVDGERLSYNQRKYVENQGFHVYGLRSWDTGTGSQLEHQVYVNHEGDVITDFKALPDDPQAFEPDFFEYMQSVGAEHTFKPFKHLYNKNFHVKTTDDEDNYEEPDKSNYWYYYYGSIKDGKDENYIVLHSQLSEEETKAKFLADFADKEPKWEGKLNAKDENEWNRLMQDLDYPKEIDYPKTTNESVNDISNVDSSHTIDEYNARFGAKHANGELWDFSEEDFWEDAVEYRWDIVYWKIGDRYYETTIPYEAKKENLDEASHRGMAYYEYKGCKVRETPDCFVATDEHGTTLGDSKTRAGAEALIDDHLNEGAEGKRIPGKEYVIYDASKDGEAPIVAIRKTYVEAQYYCNKHLTDNLGIEEVPEGKFHKGDDFWGPFDDNWEPITESKKKKKSKIHIQFPAGNPARNAEIFNHMMGSDVGASSGESSGAICCGESLTEDVSGKDWNKICSEFLDLIEFEIAKHEGEDRKSTDEYGDEYEGTWSLVDGQAGGNIGDIEAYRFDTAEDMFDRLDIYIDDYLLGEDSVEYDIEDEDLPEDGFETCADVVDWYNDEMAKKYPSKAGYVEYCDLIANHAGDVDLEKVFELQGGETTATSNAWYLPMVKTQAGKDSYLYVGGQVMALHCDEALAQKYIKSMFTNDATVVRVSSLDPNTKYFILEPDQIEDDIADNDNYNKALDFEHKLSEKEDEIRGWLSEHDQALKDILTKYNKEKLDDINFWEIVSWIEDHRELANDFRNHFGFAISMYESLDNDNKVFGLFLEVKDSNTGKITREDKPLMTGSKKECEEKRDQLKETSPEDSHHNLNKYIVREIK